MPTHKNAAIPELLMGKGQKVLGRHATGEKKIGVELAELGGPFTPPLKFMLKAGDGVSVLLNFAQ
jgi:hypothetical protein